MLQKKNWGICLAGGVAGIINGFLGAGGGMALVPLLTRIGNLEEKDVFPSSVSIILPICIVSVCTKTNQTGLPIEDAWPYVLGGVFGGFLAAFTGKRIPVKWMHRTFGLLILCGGIRYLC